MTDFKKSNRYLFWSTFVLSIIEHFGGSGCSSVVALGFRTSHCSTDGLVEQLDNEETLL